MRVRMKGQYGEVEVETTPKNLYDTNKRPKIVGDDAIYQAIKAYKALSDAERDTP